MNLQSAAVRNEQKRLRADLEAMNAQSQQPRPNYFDNPAIRVIPSMVERGLAPRGIEFPKPTAAQLARAAAEDAACMPTDDGKWTDDICSICRRRHKNDSRHPCE